MLKKNPQFPSYSNSLSYYYAYGWGRSSWTHTNPAADMELHPETTRPLNAMSRTRRGERGDPVC